MNGEIDPVYVRARRVLLDALEALRDHQAAVLLVGAQAIYTHTGESDLAVAPFTTDADLALNPQRLADAPPLEELMQRAGFVRAADLSHVGTWIGRYGVPVDLMVPELLGGSGRRGAKLGPHGNTVARKARGLEGAVIDNALRTIESLDPEDHRLAEVAVAGPSALLIAKLHKIADRRGMLNRRDDKDALDVSRLLRATSLDLLQAGVESLLAGGHRDTRRPVQDRSGRGHADGGPGRSGTGRSSYHCRVMRSPGQRAARGDLPMMLSSRLEPGQLTARCCSYRPDPGCRGRRRPGRSHRRPSRSG
ncbi:MAG: hypothetical protein IT307_09390 [Chloroflexi bacterium]|nr:hypothetical protein [Chloroflexota bacterium]